MANKNAKALIYNALLKLLKTHNLEDIKVSKLIEEAGVSRNTYYYHFYSVSNVLENMLDNFFKEYNALVNSWDSLDATDYFTGRSERLQTFEIKKWTTIYNNREMITATYAQGKGREFCLRFIETYENYFKHTDLYIEGNSGNKLLLHQDKVYDYFIKQFTFSYYGILECWISRNFAESPEDVALLWLTAFSVRSLEYSIARKIN